MGRRCMILLVLAASPLTAGESLGLKVDQVGYLPGAPKLAVVTSPLAGDAFKVKDAGNGAVVYEGMLSAARRDPDSGDEVRIADFSPVTAAGNYVLAIESLADPRTGSAHVDRRSLTGGQGADGEKSFAFAVAPDAFRDTLALSMRSFYGQRCGCAVDLAPRFPGYKHAACHLDDAQYHASSGRSGKVKSTGGWHDAGDYGKYIVNSGLSTGTLLWAWEWYGDKLKEIKLDIPESKNDVPDFLDEIRWNLDWMLTLQDEDGGVFHKLTSERFGGFTAPEKDDGGPRYVIGTGQEPYKNTGATADFAAVFAVASRVFAPFLPEDSDVYLEASKKAFGWAVAHPDIRFSNPGGVHTGGYGDGDLADEILWAAAELYRTTGDASYNRYFLEHLPGKRPWISDSDPQAWPTVGNFALWAYAMGGMNGADPGVVKKIREDTLKAAHQVTGRHPRNGYLNSMTAKNYIWGSNSVALNYSILLLAADRFLRSAQPKPGPSDLRSDRRAADRFKPDEAFRHAAWDNLHYVLGRNTFCVSWVTQVGSNAFLHPHHRPSGADKNEKPWPGLLSGGPNAGRQDPVMVRTRGEPPARAWLDEEGSYAGNEVAINWNAPLVFVLAATLP